MADPAMFDPADPAFLADPYPAFADLRARGPVHWHDGLGLFIAVSHAACDAVLRDRGLGRIWKDKEPAEQFPAFNLLHRTSILESEPPTHTRLRRLVASAFGRGHVERLRPWIQSLADGLADDLVDQIASQGTGDLLAVVAEPLPVEVIAELLGVPPSDRHQLRPWSNAIVKMYEYGLGEKGRQRAEAAAAAFVAYLRDLVAQRRRRPVDNDLVSDLVQASDGADRLSPDEVVGTCVLLLMAGHEATVNVVGNGMHALLSRPDQWRRLPGGAAGRGDGGPAGLVAACGEEMLRFDSALQLFERTATQDVEVAGTPVPQGAKIAALLGAANRDPAVFAGADTFDVARAPNPHLAFGAGIHFCLGAPLARVEIQSVLSALRDRLPDLRLAEPAPRRPEFVIRGYQRLDVTTV